MLAIVPFLIPLLGAVACLALNRVAPTRWCAFGGALALAVAAAALMMLRSQPDRVVLDNIWMMLNDRPVRLILRIDAGIWPLLFAGTAGGALGLAALGMALPVDLRGYAGLPASLLLVVLLSMLGIANGEPLLEPAVWMLAALASAMAVRASGAAGSEAPLVIGLAGSIAVVLALAAALLAHEGHTGFALACMLAGIALMSGLAPVHASIGVFAEAPASVASVLAALGLPLLGSASLVRMASLLPAQWQSGIALLGVVTLLACAAGALRERHLRRLVIWQHGAQQGMLVIAAAHSSALPDGALVTLAVTTAFTTLVGCLVAAAWERRGQDDDTSAVSISPRLTLAGLAFLIAGVAAVGAPGGPGLWLRVALAPLLAAHSWMLAGALAGSVLLAASYVVPLAALWRGPREEAIGDVAAFPAVVGAFGLLAYGAGNAILAGPARAASIMTLVAIALVVAIPLIMLSLSRRRVAADPDTHGAGAAFPSSLAASVGWLAMAATPSVALGAGWEVLVTLSGWLSALFQRFEQRYYLAGLLIALIIVILVFI